MLIELTNAELIALSVALDYADFRKFDEFGSYKGPVFKQTYRKAKDKINNLINDELKRHNPVHVVIDEPLEVKYGAANPVINNSAPEFMEPIEVPNLKGVKYEFKKINEEGIII